jgi:hypothetical protein
MDRGRITLAGEAAHRADTGSSGFGECCSQAGPVFQEILYLVKSFGQRHGGYKAPTLSDVKDAKYSSIETRPGHLSVKIKYDIGLPSKTASQESIGFQQPFIKIRVSPPGASMTTGPSSTSHNCIEDRGLRVFTSKLLMTSIGSGS